MNNTFSYNYVDRLKLWAELRNECENQSIETQCIQVDAFWQQCPLVNHYLHPDDIANWPDPWDLLNDNIYCYYARALGIIHTLLLLGIKDIDLVEAIDYNDNAVVLVLVDCAKYVMNYWPNMVINTDLTTINVKKRIDIASLVKKIDKL